MKSTEPWRRNGLLGMAVGCWKVMLWSERRVGGDFPEGSKSSGNQGIWYKHREDVKAPI